jgi:tetratricopeptide (TPR) repeat protein
MKNLTNYFLVVLFLGFAIFSSYPQQKSSANSEMENAITKMKEAYSKYDKNLLIEAKSKFEDILAKDKSNNYALYHITYCGYKLLEMSLRKGNEDLFDKYYDAALTNAEKISAQKGFESEGKTLNAAVYMMKIANSALTAVTLSGKIHTLLDEAQEIDKNNPRSYIIRGMMKYNTPGIFGGSFEEAAKNFNKAISLFEKEEVSNLNAPNWGYLESLAWLGRTQQELENYDAAMFAYKKALKVDEKYGWVKYELLPQLEQKIKENN